MVEEIYEMILLGDTSASSFLMVGSMESAGQQIHSGYYLDFVFRTTLRAMLGDLGVRFFGVFLFLVVFIYILYCGVNCHVLKWQLHSPVTRVLNDYPKQTLILAKLMQTRGRWEREEEMWREPQQLKHLCLSVTHFPRAIAYLLGRRFWQANENKCRHCQCKISPEQFVSRRSWDQVSRILSMCIPILCWIIRVPTS